MSEIFLTKPVSELSTLEALNVLNIFVNNANKPTISEHDKLICNEILVKLENEVLNRK
jgi:hypothetical protein